MSDVLTESEAAEFREKVRNFLDEHTDAKAARDIGLQKTYFGKLAEAGLAGMTISD